MPIFPFFQPRPPKIVDFGNFHKEFEKQLKKKSYLVQEINVRHVKDFDGNFYLIEIHPKIQQNHNEPYCQFIAKIKEDLENPGKSTLFRRAEISENPMKPNKTMQHSIINVDYNYHYNCARWLCSILGEPEFRIDKLEVMFPPRCDILDVFELRNFVERLEIYVDKEEQDPLLLIGWLDKFDKERLNYVKITSENVRIEVKMSEFLQNIHTLEIYGKNDVDLQWIYTSKTLKFVQNLSDNLVLTDEEIKSICEHLMDQSSSNKMLFFDQGTIERGKELKKWLREKYSDHLVGVDHFQRKIDGGKMFFFDMKNRYLKFEITKENARFSERQPVFPI
ncbi:unnamed protein product [Caenorhabditis angaria]|uniref:Uncharacterized protein n=1 Tax=Caenorhabditis angaria TaxID=860376 RepID=A0A9P1I6V6_9PELO|nr:unnamed protein product [Caenorhabditis angaria]